MNVNGSSGRTAALRASSSSAERVRPRSRTCSSVIGSSAPAAAPAGEPLAAAEPLTAEEPLAAASPAGGSITITVRRCGSWSRMASILASCSSFSHTTAHASESEITHRHSSGELVW